MRRMAAGKKQGQQQDERKEHRSSLETGHFDPAIGDASFSVAAGSSAAVMLAS
jgi:hypothetical protein